MSISSRSFRGLCVCCAATRDESRRINAMCCRSQTCIIAPPFMKLHEFFHCTPRQCTCASCLLRALPTPLSARRKKRAATAVAGVIDSHKCSKPFVQSIVFAARPQDDALACLRLLEPHAPHNRPPCVALASAATPCPSLSRPISLGL